MLLHRSRRPLSRTLNTPNRPPQPRSDWALFLDADGTLLDLATNPGAVRIPDTLVPALAAARAWLGGALAIVSGRSIEQIDQLMAPLQLPCAGEHGAVMRLPDARTLRADEDRAVPKAWRQHMHFAAKAWTGVIVEEKTYTVAIHFRQAPGRKRDVVRLLESIMEGQSGEFEILPARMAFEIRHRLLNKGVAVREFQRLAPFAGRIPVFVGDDVTDEDGFRAVAEQGGLALAVADAFGGQPSQVRRWLETFRPQTAD